ncbi:hypothetical protein REJC140_00119 [Pseudorhizobium endolithicum]|uniref:Uncharacterized protein n=1 Tax=Pseudorhizobium endolithicum TaxID=1191678 RepID=A0ABM8PCM2_9HYPH|nr:hypothetical protein [Pseudorhizobium endolithicum]CAD7023178.1 hypothetical protein REJC140_00119 [Pseudorhizobium endolithicum]
MTDHKNDPQLAEAIARRDESRAQILRSRANRLGGDATERLASAFEKMAEQAEKAARQSSTALSSIEPIKPDPEGTSRPLADSEGNFAANAEVSAVGGIGIKASNTDLSTGKPAQTIGQAGEAVMPGAQKIVGDQPAGGTGNGGTGDTDERSKVEIPANWKDLTWQERRSLASKLSDDPVSNGEEANTAIEAELKRRG